MLEHEDTKTDEQKLDGEETSQESSTETKPEEEAGASTGTEAKATDTKVDEFKDLPFHEHPRWKQREQEWNQRFEAQEGKFRDQMQSAIQGAMAANKPQEVKQDAKDIGEGPIPVWFGGGEDTPEKRKLWKEYVSEQSRMLSDAIKTAKEEAVKDVNQGRTTEQKAIDEANKWLETSMTKIEATTGKKLNREKLLKYVLDNDIVNPRTQQWDYEKGYRWMTAEDKAQGTSTQGADSLNDRKKIADISTKDSGKPGGGEGKTVTTSEDFKDSSKRPW